MKYNTVVFDLDGTLLNTLEDLADSTNYALKEFGYPVRTYDDVRRFVGNGVGVLIQLALPGGKENPDFEKVLSVFKEHYSKNCNNKTCVYKEAEELLAYCIKSGYKVAVVSNKFDAAVKELVSRYFKGAIPVAIGECQGVKRKPAPDTVIRALKELGAARESAVYIGDSEVDIETAKNAGIDCVSVTWGFRDKEWLLAAGATVIADTAETVIKNL